MTIPFLVRPGIQVESVGNSSIGVVTFLQMGDVAVLEDPATLQKKNDASIATYLVMEDVAERVSQETGVPLNYCRAKVFDTNSRKKLDAVEVFTVQSSTKAGVELDVETPLPVNTWLQVKDEIAVITSVKPNGDGLLYSIDANGQSLKKGDTVIVRELNIDEYMTRDERIDQVKTGLNAPTAVNEAVTYLIQNRVLYPVQVSSNCKPNDKGMEVYPLSFELQKGDRIKFDRTTAVVRSSIGPTPEDADTQAVPIDPTTAKIDAEDIGHVLRNGEYLKGDPNWTIADTRKLGEKLKAEIYAFYRRERAQAPTVGDDDTPTESGNDEIKQITSEADPQ